MPNRIIKESICTSENLNMLTPNAEILFYRLMVNADDFGRYYGNPGIVKAHCFPLRVDDIHSEEVSAWLDELELAGLIVRYAVDGTQYICFQKWLKHQRKRANASKFPAPESSCGQMTADDSKCPPNRNRNRDYSNRESRVEIVIENDEEMIPGLNDVIDFAESRRSKVDAVEFFRYYDPYWKDGDGKPIKNWKKLFISWERRVTDGRSSDSRESEDRFGHLRYDNERGESD